MVMRGNDTDRDWERFGREDPYFGVLFDEKYRAANLTPETRKEFFAAGEAHAAAVWTTIRDHLDAGFAPRTVLDFGCGAGRLLIPFARRSESVVGVDVSPSMLREAERNCAERAVTNVRLLRSDDRLSAVEGRFDLVHSFIVLQHVPPARGELLFAALVDRVADGGVGALHVTFANERGLRARCVAWARAALPLANRLWNLRHGRPPDAPWMQMNRYDLGHVFRTLQDRGCHDCHVRFTDHFGHRGLMIFFRKRRLPSFPASSVPSANTT